MEAIDELLNVLDPLARTDPEWKRLRTFYLVELERLELEMEDLGDEWLGPEPDEVDKRWPGTPS